MLPFLVSWGVSAMFGGGTLFIVLFLFGLAYPRLFKAFYFLLMLPVYWLGPLFILWIVLPLFGIGSWGSETFIKTLAGGLFFPALYKVVKDLDF